MTERDEVLAYMDEAASRAAGDPPSAELAEIAREAAPPPETANEQLDVARAHANFGGELPAGVRLRLLKQAIRTAARPVTSYQAEYNHRILDVISDLDRRSAGFAAAVATTDLTVDDLAAALGRHERHVSELGADLEQRQDERTAQPQRRLDEPATRNEELTAKLAAQRAELKALRAKQEMTFRAARQALPGGFDAEQLGVLSRELDRGHDDLYRDLEEVFRGSRDDVRAWAEGYLDDVKAAAGAHRVLDIGSGRGEWLEALRDHGLDANGVDTNERFVAESRDRGLDVNAGDALDHHASVPESSLGAVTGFHLAEHLSLDTLVALVDRALIALRPGGLLLLETPNPTNVVVGAAAFYLDPTHLKPLHPQFLEFLVLQRGFGSAEVRFLHSGGKPILGAGDEPDPATDAINWALFGPLDYAVLAHKPAAPPAP